MTGTDLSGFGAQGDGHIDCRSRNKLKEEQQEIEKSSKDTQKYWAALKTQRGLWMEKTSARDGSRVSPKTGFCMRDTESSWKNKCGDEAAREMNMVKILPQAPG